MDLSTAQVDAAIGGSKVKSWEPVTLPTGRQVLPEWVGRARIDWMLGWCSPPLFALDHTNASRWPDQRWEQDKLGRFITKHPDGRASCLYHRGAMTQGYAWNILRAKTGREYMHKWRLADSFEAAQVAAATQLAVIEKSHDERPEWAPMYTDGPCGPVVSTVAACTVSDEQDGFGGSHYMLSMVDGSHCLLRGPWHGLVPEGYVEPHSSGMLLLTEDLFLRIVADRTPHVGVARVNYGYRQALEVYDLAWGCPKLCRPDLG